MSRKLKIAIIGSGSLISSSPDRHLDWFKWAQLSKVQNIRDYDAVVLVLPTLDNSVTADQLEQTFNHAVAVELLLSGTRVFFLGDPRDEIGEEPTLARRLLDWTGFVFTWDNQPGDTVIIDPSWEREHAHEYLSALRGWSYSLKACVPDLLKWRCWYDQDDLAEVGLSLVADLTPYATNRYNNALAFAVNLLVQGPPPESRFDRREEERLSGEFVLLPATSRSTDEDLLVILRDFLGVDVAIPEPEWVAALIAPGQEQIDEEIARIDNEIEHQKAILATSIAERTQARVPLQLLYERGDALESAVREVLGRLGARVEVPDHPGKEDGWISVDLGSDTLEGVLEVKGTRNDQFDEGGLRQLLEWQHRGVRQRGKKYKGIFIGNRATEKPPSQRPDPFSSSWRRTATLHDFAAITTEDLYAIYAADRAGQLDRAAFWRLLFGAAGPIESSALVDQNTTAGAQVS